MKTEAFGPEIFPGRFRLQDGNKQNKNRSLSNGLNRFTSSLKKINSSEKH